QPLSGPTLVIIGSHSRGLGFPAGMKRSTIKCSTSSRSPNGFRRGRERFTSFGDRATRSTPRSASTRGGKGLSRNESQDHKSTRIRVPPRAARGGTKNNPLTSRVRLLTQVKQRVNHVAQVRIGNRGGVGDGSRTGGRGGVRPREDGIDGLH